MTRRFTSPLRPWLVDLDHLPHRPPFATFEARDHLGDPGRTIRRNLERWLATRNVHLDGGRVLMLTTPRTLGYAFNPLTVYWCHDRAGHPLCTVAEVHNTYGERHCYLLHPDDDGHADTAKEFYVSPFLEVAGDYRMRLPPPTDRLALSVVLHQDGRPVFSAVLTGRRAGRPGPGTLLAQALQPHRVRALIQRHGVALWLRRLPVVPRRPHVAQEGVQ
ncbi:DUF1365 domain-containing protein [Actinophytocola sp. S1-96]|uniref:DUF1365 domain-containing protein n=2 Tax=Actinophytocola gossypii TaxID=2812003 RepID=A0ABT2J930_9PSEU|nr:DUF1365 domain-containing protein [Actinophytocola gossypii]